MGRKKQRASRVVFMGEEFGCGEVTKKMRGADGGAWW